VSIIYFIFYGSVSPAYSGILITASQGVVK